MGRKKRSTKTKKKTKTKIRSGIKRNKSMQTKTSIGNQAQTQEAPGQNPQPSLAPVVESGFPEPSTVPSPVGVNQPSAKPSFPVSNPPQSQPQTMPSMQQSVGSPPNPSSSQSTVQAQTVPITNNPTAPVQSQEARLQALQQSQGPAVNAQDLEPQKKSKLWIMLVVFIILIVVGGALYYFREKAVKEITKEEKANDSLSSQPSPTENPSPKPSIATESSSLKTDFSKYSIRVLNGSGIKGEASKVKDSLEEEEFVVEDIDNADSSDYEKTVIRAKEDVSKEYLDKLKTLLEKTYVLDTEEKLEESASIDVIVIIGKSQKP